MRIGVTFNVRLANAVRQPGSFPANSEDHPAGLPALGRDDADEEFDSPETIQALATDLESLGHDVELLGDGEPMLRRLLAGPRPDLVWNIAEGTGGGRSRSGRPGMVWSQPVFAVWWTLT